MVRPLGGRIEGRCASFVFACTIDHERNCRIVIRPNRSLTWRQTQLVYAFIATYSLAIAGSLALLGFWPVLPFAGGELVALAACFYACASGGNAREIVDVGESTVAVKKARHGRSEHERWEFQRAWARVKILRHRIDRYPSRLVIRSHGKQVDLGGFLSEDERRALAGQLEKAIAGTV